MHFLSKTSLLLICLCLSQLSFALTLNGTASYQQLRKEFYIASLYLSETSKDPQAIITSNGNKRMVLKVTAKRWSPRRWSLQWQNDIAINNSFSNDDELTNQLLFFTGYLQAPLRAGDEVIIDYIATQGTTVSINGVKIIHTETYQLFHYLLNAWIGKLPPSGEFKQRILNKINDKEQQALKTRYDNISFTKERSDVIRSWIQAKEDLQLAELKAIADKKKAAARKLAQASQKKKKEKAKAKKSPPKIKTYAAAKKVIKKKKPIKKKKIASLKASKKKLSKKELAAQQKYYLALYQWELSREIREAVIYPEWAKRFGQKGTATVKFSVNRKAEAGSITKSSSGTSELLLTEVKKAISEVVPFILPPDALRGKKWDFSFTYIFNPKSDKQPYLKKPKKPGSLNSTKRISRSNYKKVLSHYIDDVRRIIIDNIEYPVWAKKLNQKGNVKIEITVNREGVISSSKEITLSRHEILNQEVRDAIEHSQPLPPIPERLGLNQTNLVVEYRFK